MNDQSGPLFAIGALLVAGAALAFVAWGNLGENLVYYWSPTELHAAGDNAYGATVRLGGVVVPESVQWTPGEPGTFRITDGNKTVPISSAGIPPQMFREGIGVVVEGQFEHDGFFHTERVMVKHGNEYRAPEDGEGVDVESIMKTLEES